MKSKIRLLGNIILSLVFVAVLGSCGDDPETPSDGKEKQPGGLTPEAKTVFDRLHDTTWALVSSPNERSPLGETITFSSKEVVDGYAFELYCSAYPDDTFAWVPAPDNNRDLLMTGALTHCNASNSGAFSMLFGIGGTVSIANDRMVMRDASKEYIYSKNASSGSGGQGGTSGYETPDVGFYDYTQQTSSSVRVDFIVYNMDAAGVSSAKIKYGTSASATNTASSTIVGKHVIATISGLKPDKKYYVKCEVRGKGGTVTTEAVPVSITKW